MPLLTTDSSGLPLLFGRTTLTLAGAVGPPSAGGGVEGWVLAGAGAAMGEEEAGSGVAGLAEGAVAGAAAGADGAGAAGLTVGARAGPAKGVGPGRMLEMAVAAAFPAALAL
ncbi:MAG: hypothetical protein KGL63_14180, partial [Betaproteobacteria bacterium]|nr:hypothetical protein [Betaproteobacteria bacterium]